jgi:hypothetical protein
MSWATLRQRILAANLDLSADALDRPIIHVDSARQTLQLLNPDNEVRLACSISTSRHGLGQRSGSYQTPAGIHRIADRIGEGEVEGRVFRGRVATDEICNPEDYDGKGDRITSRILWLEGLEEGFNRGGEVDSHERYIYIHGTPDEAHIGQPASIGCVRMNNADVIALFELTRQGDLVVID